MTAPVMAIGEWRTNGEMIADVASLYLDRSARVLDPTFGSGTWWSVWEPADLVACDLDPARSPLGRPVDFRALPWSAGSFDAVGFDPPYKLNGTPTPEVDARYGVAERRSRDDRYRLILDGLAECVRVLRPGGLLLVKCQDQVEGGRVRWQTDVVSAEAERLGAGKIDAFLFRSYRPQPLGRSQAHARRNYSTLLVFREGWSA